MKLIAACFTLLLTSVSFAQTWQTINRTDFGFPTGGWLTHTFGSNHGFNISPYDNSIWLSQTDRLTRIDENGNLTEFDINNHPILNDGEYIDFAFANNTVYALDKWSGIYSFDGTDWTLNHTYVYGSSLNVDGDTIWIGEAGGIVNSAQIISGNLSFLDHNYQNIQSKNGVYWINNGTSGISRYYSGVTGQLYSPDTCMLLGWDVSTFKFSPNTDSLYVAGDLGVSIAHDDMFIDTITTHNTFNMPSGHIKEMEFDTDDNIWALFAESTNSSICLAFLDRSTMSWTIYDTSNSPISFPQIVYLELDTFGNVWVAQNNKLHCLKLGSTTQWLGQNEMEKIPFSIFPNPTTGNFTISLTENSYATQIHISDIEGRLITSKPYVEKTSLDLPKGVYFITLLEGDIILGTEKLIVR